MSNKVLYDPFGHKLIDIPKEIKSTSIVVIDIDWISFKIASVLEDKYIKVYEEDTLIGKFKNRTEYKKKTLVSDVHKIEDCQDLRLNYKDTMKYLFKTFIDTIKKDTKCSSVVLAAGGTNNFRDNLPLPVKYKGNRENSIKPLALKECKDFISHQFPTCRDDSLEADDIISMFQYRSSYDTGIKIVVCTPDKDALQTQGYLYNPESSKGMSLNEVVLIDGLGYVDLKKMSSGRNKLIFSGRKALYSQLLTGDSTDGYLPCTLFKLDTGITKQSSMLTDLKVYNMLKDLQTDKDCFKVIHDQYYEWYKGVDHWYDWRGEKVIGNYIDLLQLYWDCAFMLRYPGDKVDLREVLRGMGVIDKQEK